MRLLILLFLMAMNHAYALVGGSDTLGANEHRISFEAQIERGKVEPNENKTSFQNANINIHRIKYSQGLSDFSVLLQPTLNFEYGHFNSAEEKVGATSFYAKDSGYYSNLGISADFIHDPDKQFGFYLNFRPIVKYNVNKFSNPRLDKFSLGITNSSNFTENVFQKNQIHFGSGDGKAQNPYLAVNNGFGFRLNQYFDKPSILSAGLVFEADLKDRYDDSYDAAFSAPGKPDRVRAFKYGVLVGVNMDILRSLSVSVDFLQKLGGYDARATQIAKAGLNYKF